MTSVRNRKNRNQNSKDFPCCFKLFDELNIGINNIFLSILIDRFEEKLMAHSAEKNLYCATYSIAML